MSFFPSLLALENNLSDHPRSQKRYFKLCDVQCWPLPPDLSKCAFCLLWRDGFIGLETRNISKCLVKPSSGQQGCNRVKNITKLKGFIRSAQQTPRFSLLSITEPLLKLLTLY